MIKFARKRLDTLIHAFSGKRILVLGDLMIDEYLIGHVSRISPEAPVPVVEISEQTYRLGGAANVALNVMAVGCIPVMIGVIGDDQMGTELLRILKRRKIDNSGIVRLPNRPTTVKTRIIGSSQHVARVDREENSYIDQTDEEKIIDKINILIDTVDGIIVEDYNKGILTENVIEHIINVARRAEKVITVDPKFKNFMKYRNVSLFKPNIKETEEALAISISDETDLIAAGKRLKQELEAESILITRGSAGMSLFENDDKVMHVETKARKVADVSGAGDTVISTLTAALIGGASFKEAATMANYAAGLVCEEIGIAPVDSQKLYRSCLGKNTQ